MEKFLTVKETAEMLNVSVSLVYSLCNRRELPCIRLGRAIRIPSSQIQQHLQNLLTPAVGRWQDDEEK